MFPIVLTLGTTALFTAKDYDVLYVEVRSPDLVALNQRLTDMLEVTNTHPVYTPHATVAYLKRGLGQRYVGNLALEGMSASIGSVRFSPVEGEDVDVRLTGRAGMIGAEASAPAAEAMRMLLTDEDEAVIEVLAAALRSGNDDVVKSITGMT